jgi:hypothetical protein
VTICRKSLTWCTKAPPVSPKAVHPSEEFLGQRDDDARRASNVAESVDLDTFEPVDAVHPRALDGHLAFERHAKRGEKSDSGCKVVDDDADVVQSLDRHVPSMAPRPG